MFTDFSPPSLRIFGISPEDYLKKLIEYSFELHQIDEEQRAINRIAAASITSVTKILDDKRRHTNFWCKRVSSG